MTRLVLDTNILISALGWKNGKPRKIFDECISGKYQPVESIDLINELLNVFDRDKFSFISKDDKQEFILHLFQICEVIETKTKIDLIKEDLDDNVVLECAFDGNVDYIISGDPHLLNLKEFKGIKILSASDFLNKENLKEK